MVGAKSFQIIWVIGVRPNLITWWLVFRCVEGEERILSTKKERSFIKSSQKKAQSLANGNGHFCFYAIIKTPMFTSNIGKKRYQNKLPNSGFCSGYYFIWSEEFIQGNDAIG